MQTSGRHWRLHQLARRIVDEHQQRAWITAVLALSGLDAAE
ncbi:hypothetical protein ACC745_02455 [Rhizobium ruizarguesonis]